MPKTTKRLAPGIYQDQYGIRAVVAIAAGRKEKRFDADTSLREIRHWRNATKVKLERRHPQKRAGAIGRGTLSADAKRHIARISIASWKSRRSELKAWEKAKVGTGTLGRMKRRRITDDHVRRVIRGWVDAGVPAKTIVNRVRALTAMYHDLDGKDAWTPADEVVVPKPRQKPPDYVAPERLIEIEKNLHAMALANTLEDGWKWRARFMVNAAHGARPVHVKMTAPKDVDLERRRWRITSAKGGKPIVYPLNNDQAAAWQAFIEADAFGDYDDTKYAQILRSAGWPAGIDPYSAKHSFGQDLADAGIDHDTIADLYGHTDTKTTRIYVPIAKLKRASDAIDGRLGWGVKLKGSLAGDLGRRTGQPSNEQIQQALEILRRAAYVGS